MSLLSDLGTKIGTKLKELTTLVNTKLDKNTGSATITYENSGNTTVFRTASQIGHPTVLVKKEDDASNYNTALMIATDADSSELDSGASDLALDIRGTDSAPTTIIDYSDITHRNAFITGGGTIWSKRYINAEIGLQESGVDISTKYLGINDNAVSATNANTLDGIDSTQFARKDIAETFAQNVTFNGEVTLQSASFNVSDSIFFENKKHAITYNDAEGNFNIRVGHVSNSTPDEVCTEAGYTFQTEWSQSAGWWQQNISQQAAVGDSVIWQHTLQFDTTGLKVNGKYAMTGTKHVSTAAPIYTDGVDGDVWYQV